MNKSANHRDEIAAKLRDAITQSGMELPDVNVAIGFRRNDTRIYNWLKARSTPPEDMLRKLATVLAIPEQELMPPAPILPRVGEVLTVTVNDAGNARIRLDVTLPLAQAMPLLRLLLTMNGIPEGEL